MDPTSWMDDDIGYLPKYIEDMEVNEPFRIVYSLCVRQGIGTFETCLWVLMKKKIAGQP